MENCPQADNNERRVEDRRCRRQYVFRDKRSGFDRRKPSKQGLGGLLHDSLIGLRDNPASLRVLLIVVNALNLLDFVLTLHALSTGAREANPVMASLFNASPLWAGIFKTLAVLLATALVWECKRYRKALMAAVTMFMVFAAIFIYHMVGLTLLS